MSKNKIVIVDKGVEGSNNFNKPSNDMTPNTNFSTVKSIGTGDKQILQVIPSKTEKKPETRVETRYNSADLTAFYDSAEKLATSIDCTKEILSSNVIEEMVKDYEQINSAMAINLSTIKSHLSSEQFSRLISIIKSRNEKSEFENFQNPSPRLSKTLEAGLYSTVLSNSIQKLNFEALNGISQDFALIGHSVKFLDSIQSFSNGDFELDVAKVIIALYQGEKNKSAFSVVKVSKAQITSKFEQYMKTQINAKAQKNASEITTQVKSLLKSSLYSIKSYISNQFDKVISEVLDGFTTKYLISLTDNSKNLNPEEIKKRLAELRTNPQLNNIKVGSMNGLYFKNNSDSLKSLGSITLQCEYESALLSLYTFIAELRNTIDQFSSSTPDDSQRKLALFFYNNLPQRKQIEQISDEELIVSSLMEPVFEFAENSFSKTIKTLFSKFSKDFVEFVRQAPIKRSSITKASELKNIDRGTIYYEKQADLPIRLKFALSIANSILKTRYLFTHDGLPLVTASIAALKLSVDQVLLDMIKSWSFVELLKEGDVERGKKDIDIEDYVLLYLIKVAASAKDIEAKPSIDIGIQNFKYLFSN